jgi:exopolyphosphatase/guanosine-5'-triphosphate,3'-diphosphate pyrophosphatase
MAKTAASIDIGTNSVLLLVAELNNGRISVRDELQHVPRLGKGVDQDKALSTASCDRVLSVLSSYKSFLKEKYPDTLPDVIVTATSAVRDASNRDQFIKSVRELTGWEIRLLSGDEEALATYTGALSVLPESDLNRVVLDIGGGSTEIALGINKELKTAISVDMGSVRFSERFLTSDPPDKEQVSALRNEVDRLLTHTTIPDGYVEVVGVAGTVTSIAAIEFNLKSYDSEKVNGFLLRREVIANYIDEFTGITAEAIEQKYSPFLKGRGDVILGGLLILDQFLKWCKSEGCTVSSGGIRHGVLIERAEK